MTEIKAILDFLSKLTIKDIGFHLSNVALLYTRPLRTYRRLIKDEYDSYHFFILFILYYAFLIFFIVDNPKWIIPFTLLEIILTIFPFSFLIIPFNIFKSKYYPNLKSSGLFRLLFVVKLQFGIFLILGILLARWSKMESIYILIDNISILLFLPLISALPLALKLRFTIKVFWIFVNYIFSLLYLCVFGITMSYIPDSDIFYEKLIIKSPITNYIVFQSEYNLSDLDLSNRFIAFISSEGQLLNTQFASNPACQEILKVVKLDLARQKQILDSLIKKEEKYLPAHLNRHHYVLSKATMDSIKQQFNKQFYQDVKRVESFRKSEEFESNKKLYSAIGNFLTHHDSIHKSTEAIQEIFKQEPDMIVRCDNNTFALLYTLKKERHEKLADEINILRINFENRLEQSSFFANIYLYPIMKIFN